MKAPYGGTSFFLVNLNATAPNPRKHYPPLVVTPNTLDGEPGLDSLDS